MLSAAAPGQKKRKRGGEVEVVVCPSAFPDFSTVGGSTSRRLERSRRGHDNVDDDNRRRGFQGRGGGGGGGGGGRVGRYARDRKGGKDDDDGGSPPELDVQETIREIHKFGAEGFTGAMRKNHQNAEYEKLTGRTTKRQKIPTKILVGMRQKATKREDRRKREERESGVVGSSSSSSQGTTTTTTTTKKKKRGAKNDKRPSDDAKRGGGAAVGPRGVFGSNRARNTGDRRKMSPRSFGPSPDVGFMLKGILKVKQPPGGGRR